MRMVILRKILKFNFKLALSIYHAWKSDEYDFKSIN
jgi:hypothetical protein